MGHFNMAAIPEGVYFLVRNKCGKRVYFLTRNKENGGKTLAIDDPGKVTHTIHRDPNGWEGFRIEQSEVDGVFFLVRNKDKKQVLACNDNGEVCTTKNKASAGWEGWRFELAGSF